MSSKEKFDVSSIYSKKLIKGKVSATNGVVGLDKWGASYGSIGENRIDILRELEKESKFKLIWYIIFVTLGFVCLFITPAGWFNVLDLFVVMVNIDLVSRGKVIGLYIGTAECLMYIYICFLSGLYGEIIKMCIINIPLNVIAIINWTKNLKKQKEKKYEDSSESDGIVIRKLSKKSYALIIPLMAVLFVGCFFGLKLLNTNALIFSAGVLVLTIFSKILSGLRYKENYIFGIISYTIQTAMWVDVIIESSLSANALDLTTLALMVTTIACIVSDINAYILWKSMYRKVAINGGEVLAMRKVNIKKIIKLRHTYQNLKWNKEIDIARNS